MNEWERDDAQDAQAADAEAGRGWEGLSEWTGGIAPESVQALAGVRELESLYPLLHSLVGRSPREFFARAAAIEALVASGLAAFRPQEIAETLYWLDEEPRDAVVRSLRSAGWLDYDPSAGFLISGAGRWVYEVLAFLHKKAASGDIRPTLAGVEYAIELGLDPARHLQSMKSRLLSLRREMEVARASHSAVGLRDAAHRLGETLELSEQIRAVLDRIPAGDRGARGLKREIHDLLSRLHRVGADLEEALAAVGRQQLRLTAGLSVEQIVRALMARSRDELAVLGRSALLPIITAPGLLTTDCVASAAELQCARERGEVEETAWAEPAGPARGAEDTGPPEEVTEWLLALREIERGRAAVPLAATVPHRDAAHSFLRLSLLALVGDARTGEGIAGQLGALGLDIVTESGHEPAPLADGPLARLTPGSVRPRAEAS